MGEDPRTRARPTPAKRSIDGRPGTTVRKTRTRAPRKKDGSTSRKKREILRRCRAAKISHRPHRNNPPFRAPIRPCIVRTSTRLYLKKVCSKKQALDITSSTVNWTRPQRTSGKKNITHSPRKFRTTRRTNGRRPSRRVLERVTPRTGRRGRPTDTHAV